MDRPVTNVTTPVTPEVPSTPTIVELAVIQSKSDDENVSKTAFCKMEIVVPEKDVQNITKTKIVVLTLDKVVITLEKKIDGTESKVAGIKISPYPSHKPAFSSNVTTSVSVITHVIAKIFALLSTEPNTSLTPIEKQLKAVITRNFGSEKMDFIVFKDSLIQLSSLSAEDQRTEIVKIFTPVQERPSTVAKGNLNFDKQFFTDNNSHIALYYDIALHDDLDKLETGLTQLFNTSSLTKEPVDTTEETKNESKTIMSFKQFSTRLLPEAVVTDLAKSIESTVKKGLTSISYDPAKGTVFTPPIQVEFPIKWDTIKTLTLTDQQKTEFNTVFNNPDYSVLVDGKDVTVTPSTFTFNL